MGETIAFPCPGCGEYPGGTDSTEGDVLWAAIHEDSDVLTVIGYQHKVGNAWVGCPVNPPP